MSFFKKLFAGIVVGAIVGLTGGAALLAMGVTSIGTGAAAIGITLKGAAIYGAVYGGLQGAAAGFIRKPKISTGEVLARTNISVDPQTLGKWIFGETSAGTDVVYSEKIDETAIVHVIAAAAHEVESFGSLYINDELITLSGTSATGAWANALSVYRNLGTETQSALSIPSSSWPSSARGLGIAHYALKWDFSSDNGKKQLSGGIPTRITQVIRGAKLYDPRKDSTRGGTGSHRADNQSTWEWSDNWALVVAHYLLGWYSGGSLIYGVGTDPDNIDWASVITMADVCDTVVDSKPKYRVGGIFAITQDHENIIGQLESAVGGKVSMFGGKYYVWVPHNDLTSVGTLTDADIVAEAGIIYTPSGPIEGLFNTARGQYVEPSLLYLLQPYPEVIESAAVTEDGKDRVLQQDFALIQDVEIAERVARELVRRSRFSGSIKVVVGPKGLLVKPFDVITVNFRETNFTNELFRVISMQYSAGGAIIMELLEEDASIYDVTTPLGPSLVQLDPTAYNPATAYSVSSLSLTNVSIAGSGGTVIDGVRVSWATPSSFVEFTEGGFRKSGDSDFIYDRVERGATSGVIAPVQPNTLYEFRVRHVSINGVAGPYATASITTGTTTSVGSAVIADGSITTNKLANLAVVAAKVADSAIETAKIANLAVDTAKLANAAATEAKIAANAITETKISDLAISTPKLAAGAVTAAKITAGTITATEIAASTITGAKIAAGTITAANIQALTITASEIASNAITAAKILAGEITGDKISSTFTTTSNLVLTTAGKLYTSGKTSAASTTAGVFLGHDGGTNYDFAVGDGSKSIVWDGSAGTFTVTNVNISTNGQLISTGSSASSVGNASVVGAPSNTGVIGVLGLASSTHTVPAVYGYSSSTSVGAAAVYGQTTVLGIPAIVGSAGASASGGLGGNFFGNVCVGGAELGGATNTGVYNIIVREGTVGSRLNNQFQIYGQLSADSQTTLGLVLEQGVESGTGAFSGISQLRIHINGVAYKLPLEAY